MRRVTWGALPEPQCLREQRESGNCWSDLPGSCKQQVRQSLRELQEGLCIYCERRLTDDHCHVEHLEPQSVHPKSTLKWDNLSLSCNGEFKSCGDYKGNASLPILPQDFTQAYPFRVVDGTLRPRDEEDPGLASLLEVVNLNGTAIGNFNLRNLRQALFKGLFEALSATPELSDDQAVRVASRFWQERGCPSTAVSVLEALGYSVAGLLDHQLRRPGAP